VPATTTCWSSTTCWAASCTGSRTGEEGREGGRRAWKGLTHRAGIDAAAILCVIIFLALPPMEIIPFTANAVGIALLVLGLGPIANDGLLAILAFVISAGSIGLVLYYLVF
jgi:hypothetical protein